MRKHDGGDVGSTFDHRLVTAKLRVSWLEPCGHLSVCWKFCHCDGYSLISWPQISSLFYCKFCFVRCVLYFSLSVRVRMFYNMNGCYIMWKIETNPALLLTVNDNGSSNIIRYNTEQSLNWTNHAKTRPRFAEAYYFEASPSIQPPYRRRPAVRDAGRRTGCLYKIP